MEEMLINFFSVHGWKLTLLALSGIPILGIFKRAHVFDKIEKAKRKPLFILFSSIFSLAVSLIYLLVIDKFNAMKFFLLTISVLGVNQATYAVYENYGLRTLVDKLFGVLSKIFKNISSKDKTANDDIDLIDNLSQYNDK